MTTYKPPTELDRAALRAMGHRIPKGCDHQGRYPEAAEAATELGADDDRPPITGARPLVLYLLMALAIVGCAGIVVFVR